MYTSLQRERAKPHENSMAILSNTEREKVRKDTRIDTLRFAREYTNGGWDLLIEHNFLINDRANQI